MTTDIDEIWKSMKSSSSKVTTKKKVSSLPSSHKAKNIYKQSTGNKSKSSIKNYSHVLKQTTSTTNKNTESHEVLSTKVVGTENTKIIEEGGEDEEEEENISFYKNVNNIEDSDDDSDEEKYITNYYNVNREQEHQIKVNINLQRTVRLMQSDNASDRVHSLKSLHDLVKKIFDTLKIKVPKLDFPPPYDISRIALTHKQYDTLVSDLANGDHVKAWGIWQRTKSSIMDQFIDNAEMIEDTDRRDSPNGTEDTSTIQSLQHIMDFCGSTLFRRFSDKSEACRSYAIGCIKMLCLANIDIGKHLGFLMPVITGKYPSVYFDAELNVFVDNADDHQFYKRGGATERQDRTNLLSGCLEVRVVDKSEEIRLSLCELISCLVRCLMHDNRSTSLDAYFTDIILSVQSNLKDPFPKLKIVAANLLVQILRVPRWELGAKEFATAVARAAMPNLRHRNSKVRLSAIYLFEASVSVPNRDKIRGAGTDAIVDLIGFREENVLPIAAFYKYECGVTVNILAELVIDKTASVRLACCQMLSFLMNCLPDRYDHQQRLLPYLLSFYNDEIEEIQKCAKSAIDCCGEQYEAENPNEIVERRQYKVDGSERCNHVDALPFPFDSRPRLGARLFVRANSKRFFSALLDELTSWISKTRFQSAKLLRTLIVYSEEHITMDSHNTIVRIVKALQLANKEEEKHSKSLSNVLQHILELIGRFIEPQTYIKILLPRVTGDVESATSFAEGGLHSNESCVANSIALCCMMKGTLPKTLLSSSFLLINTLSSSLRQYEYKGMEIIIQWLLILKTVLDRLKDVSFAGAQSACFDETGRIHSSEEMIKKCKLSIGPLIDDVDYEDTSIHKLSKSVMGMLLSIEK